MVRRRGIVGRIPNLQLGGPGSIPCGSGILIFTLGLGVCPSFVFYCVVSGGGPDIVLTTH